MPVFTVFMERAYALIFKAMLSEVLHAVCFAIRVPNFGVRIYEFFGVQKLCARLLTVKTLRAF